MSGKRKAGTLLHMLSWLFGYLSCATAKSIWIMGVGLRLGPDQLLFRSLFQKACTDARVEEMHWVEDLDGSKLWSIFQSIEKQASRDKQFSLFLLCHGGWTKESINPGRGEGRLQGANGDNLALLLGRLPNQLRFLAIVSCFSTSIFRSVQGFAVPQGLKLVTFDDEVPPVLALELALKEAEHSALPITEGPQEGVRKVLRCHIPLAMRLRLESAGEVLAWINTEGPATLLLELKSESLDFISQISEPMHALQFEDSYTLVESSSGSPLGTNRWVYRFCPPPIEPHT